MKTNKIKYIGDDVYGQKSDIRLAFDYVKNKHNHYNELEGKKLLTKNKIYDLSVEWDVDMFINDHWVFYVYDDLEDGESRGHELHRSEVAHIRELNLSILGI